MLIFSQNTAPSPSSQSKLFAFAVTCLWVHVIDYRSQAFTFFHACSVQPGASWIAQMIHSCNAQKPGLHYLVGSLQKPDKKKKIPSISSRLSASFRSMASEILVSHNSQVTIKPWLTSIHVVWNRLFAVLYISPVLFLLSQSSDINVIFCIKNIALIQIYSLYLALLLFIILLLYYNYYRYYYY